VLSSIGFFIGLTRSKTARIAATSACPSKNNQLTSFERVAQHDGFVAIRPG
jgi:hypothetical protein